jgi:K+-transporting ATPase ATPase C chain
MSDLRRSTSNHLSSSVRLLAVMSVLTGIAYPLAVTGIARWLAPWPAGGSVIESGGRLVGSALIGQPFDDPGYFWGRSSATPAFPYNAASSAGSNLDLNNPALTGAVSARAAALRSADPGNEAPIPVDLVTASGSGLDPHLSPAAAAYQVRRVARVRGLTQEQVQRIVEEHTEGRTFGLLGEPRVHVLELNLALDALAPRDPRSP